MKTALFAAALLIGGAAAAQTTTTGTMAGYNPAAPSAGQTVQPDNSNPERDARGIPVISDPAVVPAGFNLIPGMGGPDLDAATGTTPQPATQTYPACSRTVTDNCVQTYERGRR